MRILAFESSAKSASTAILEDGKLLAEYYQNGGQTHSRTLTQMAADMILNCDLTENDIDACAVASGPGSFTGVRIGVAAAKGFAWGREIPCYGVSTLEAMVLGAACADGIWCGAMDARRNQVYNALFLMEQGVLRRLTEDRAISIAELAEDLNTRTKPKFLVGDGALLCYNTLSSSMNLNLLPESMRMQRASGVAIAAWKQYLEGEPGDAGSLVPQYLRLSQAERERLEHMK